MQRRASRATLRRVLSKFLRTDPQFYAKTPHQSDCRSALHRQEVDDLKLKDTIGTLPRFPARHSCRCPMRWRRSTPAGRGGRSWKGAACVNTYNLPARPSIRCRRWCCTSARTGPQLPGRRWRWKHRERPKFRNDVYFSALRRGWALYTENGWAVVMGVYETPYENVRSA